MLEVTPSAERYLANLRRERGVDDRAAARLVSKGGRVGVTFAPAPLAGHRVVDGDVIKIYVPPEIAEPLGESIIDVHDEHGQARLVMRKRATPTDEPPRG